MKTYRQFIMENAKKKPKSCVVYAIPTHGSHASTAKPTKKTIKEEDEKKFYQWAEKEDNSHLTGENEHSEGSSEKLGKILHKSHPITKATKNERNALDEYTSSSARVNRHLINLAQGRQSEFHNKTMIPHLDTLTTRHTLPHDMSLYSGVGFHPGQHAEQSSTSTIHLPAYTSTSTNKRTASMFARADENGDSHILHIHAKQGQKGFYVGKHSATSNNEYETLLPRDTKLSIDKKPESYRNWNGNYTHVWHAYPVEE
jgi:hypothetical protein